MSSRLRPGMPQVMPGVPVVMPGAMPGAMPGVMPGAMPPGAVGPAQGFEARSGFCSVNVALLYSGVASMALWPFRHSRLSRCHDRLA